MRDVRIRCERKNNHPQGRIKVRIGPLPPISMLTVFWGKVYRREKNTHFRPSLRAIRVNIEIGGAGVCAPRRVCHRDGCFFARTGIDCGCSMVMCKLSRVRARDVARGVISVCAVASCTAPSERQQGGSRALVVCGNVVRSLHMRPSGSVPLYMVSETTAGLSCSPIFHGPSER